MPFPPPFSARGAGEESPMETDLQGDPDDEVLTVCVLCVVVVCVAFSYVCLCLESAITKKNCITS